MSLGDELRQQIRAFVTGTTSANELFAFVASIGPEVDEAGDLAVRDLRERTFLLLSELSYGACTEQDIRDALAELVPSARTSRVS